jgi:pilus assembly protein FimV
MAFTKNKALENALKFLNQGKVAQAIAEYQQILRNDPKDQATLMTVGDLFARQGDMTHAIEYFERLAQVYLNDGFNSKAIAIYKKIAKLAPNELDPLERLADLYVQQGVLSEARPLFLQIAEAHLKSNRAPKAVEILHRLLDVEPENLRVQMRLAELYNVMGQKKEAAQTYLSYAQRLFDNGELDESQKLIERALEVDAANAPALVLKARVLAGANKDAQAVKILEGHPDANAGGDVTNLLVDLELKAGQNQKAAERARKQLARGHAHFAPLYKVAENLVDVDHAEEALPLLNELRGPMIEAAEQDKFLQALSRASEKLPGQIGPLEMLVDFCRTTSDPFQLNDAIGKLSDAFAAKGDYGRAEELLQELVDRNKNDERLVERLNQLRARSGGAAEPMAQAPAPVSLSAEEAKGAEPVAQVLEEPAEETPAPAAIIEETLDEETQRYIAQALTDVDLFSSYGLTQKATHLLESVLERVPRHTPTLERLLDLHLGSGNERRTAELASQLEQIHLERNDAVNAERFSELRTRFQKAAGLTEEDLPPAPPATPAARVEMAAGRTATGPAEFEVPLAEVEPESTEDHGPAAVPFEVSGAAATAEPSSAEAPGAEAATGIVGEEVDLSDEWEAIAQEVAEPKASGSPAEAAEETIAEAGPEAVSEAASEAVPEAIVMEEETEAAGSPVPAEEAPVAAEEEPVELQSETSEKAVRQPEAEPEPAIEIVEESEEPVAESGEFELELTAAPAAPAAKAGAATTEEFISELVAEVDDMEAPVSEAATTTPLDPILEPAHESLTTMPAASGTTVHMASGNGKPASSTPVPETTAESLNQLAEVFQEFREELGELGDEDEDLETHYNLGIAYREMGLLDEAIGEFQKVAKAIQKGKPFRYAMNCSTLLALSFMDKGEPKIAALWYRRALEVPGLEQETILALRYDFAIALETAGESDAALDSFRQVYAMNIDYRDVADRIATIQKH